MATRSEIRGQIRFGLDQLSSRNAHHEFEAIGFQLARARLSSNLLPATGPVSAGGDQGRDFETFRSYLQQVFGSSAFLGMVADKPITFVCSTQKEDIASKIRDDVAKVMAAGRKPDAIYALVTADVQIAKRHELEEWAKQTYSVHLEILDGQAIAEQLADPDLFWVASKHMDIPSEIYPNPAGEATWYQQRRQKWLAEKPLAGNYADFYEIVFAARHAAFVAEHRSDAAFWLDRLSVYRGSDVPPDFRRRAIHETAVVSLVALGTLRGLEAELREYFASIGESDRPSQVEAIVTSLVYCLSAIGRGAVEISKSEVATWLQQAHSRIEDLLSSETDPSRRCSLLETLGYTHMAQLIMTGDSSPLDQTFDAWGRLVEALPQAHLYPLERFADRLTAYATMMGDHPQYPGLTRSVDELLASRAGEFVAAAKARDRAISFYRNGAPLRAIAELHHAKVKWFAQETLYGSVLAMTLLAQWYQEVGLASVAKHYGFAASFVSFHSENPKTRSLAPTALLVSAEAAYASGAWMESLTLIDLALNMHARLSTSAGSERRDWDLDRAIQMLATLLLVGERIAPTTISAIQTVVDRWALTDVVATVVDAGRPVWQGRSPGETVRIGVEQLGSAPFSDLGESREITWHALGVSWSISFRNEPVIAARVEEFVALVQVLLADVAAIDLCLLPSEVRVRAELSDVAAVEVREVPDNTARPWILRLPRQVSTARPGWDEYEVQLIAAAIQILSDVSLVPRDRLLRVVKERFRDGLRMKVFVAQPFHRLHAEFLGQLRATGDPPDYGDFDVSERMQENKQLPWRSGPGPGYTLADAEQAVSNRYRNTRRICGITMERLCRNPDFRQIVATLRAEGYLDWHILNAVASIALNHRLNALAPASSPDDARTVTARLMEEAETEGSLQVPDGAFSEEAMRQQLNFSMVATIRGLGLEIRQMTPDFGAIRRFLAERYGYLTDDIDHQPVCGPL